MECISSCGLFDCASCRYRGEGTCPGCRQGNAFLEAWGRTPCAVYACVRGRGIGDCRACTNAECALHGKLDTVCPLREGTEERSHWVWRVARHLEKRGGPCASLPPLPLKTLMRFRWYVAALGSFALQGLDIISSRELADKVGVGAAMVRKDLSHIGDLGTPGIGYPVSDLQERIRGLLEHHVCLLAWVGAEWLSSLLTTFAPALELNFRIVAAFDTSPDWIGRKIGQWEVLPLSDLPALFSEGHVDGAVLAMPESAGRVAEALVDAGARGILNLTPEALSLPPHVSVRHVDLIGEIMALAMEVSDGHGATRQTGREQVHQAKGQHLRNMLRL